MSARPRALLSVHDKTGIVELARALAGAGVELVSTGGTKKALAEAGLPVTDVSEITGHPEIMDGRVKTLHPKVHGGLLAKRDDPAHVAAMDAHAIGAIDVLVVNLYPFEATLASGASFAETIEMIDIGGPAMIRAAAKNHADVTVVVDPADYEALSRVIATGGPDDAFRRRMAAKAFARTASYDAGIAAWLGEGDAGAPFAALGGTRLQTMRYGENPHQAAAFYRTTERRFGVATARQIQGKELSYNNIADADAAFEAVAEFADGPAVVIVKHANPCGIATAPALADAWTKALACDPVSAFGGIVAVNRTLDRATAERITSIFTEVIIAPDADPDALEVIAAKKQLRLLLTGGMPDPAARGTIVKPVAGGFLVQDRDFGRAGDLRVVTRRAPTLAEHADLLFAWACVKHVKSNAIVFAKGGATVSIGAGQMSRVDSVRIARWKADETARASGLSQSPTMGAVVASDAFFPFADGLEALIAAGATAVVQPGGSVRDAEVIAAADAAGIAMVFTGMRHFRH
jgi:phosphoribosylaminoimidazolecarboxamide formyltransferase/IMP cyclohydrolase